MVLDWHGETRSRDVKRIQPETRHGKVWELSVEACRRVLAEQVNAFTTGESEGCFDHGASDASASVAHVNGKVCEVGLQFAVAEQLGEAENCVVLEGDDGGDAGGSEDALSAFGICRERRPILGNAQSEHAVEVIGSERLDLHARQCDSSTPIGSHRLAASGNGWMWRSRRGGTLGRALLISRTSKVRIKVSA